MNDIYRSQFRLPYSLYESLKDAADANRRSVNAELVARLEASISIDEAIQSIAPGCPISDAGQLILDLAIEREEAIEELHQMNIAVHAKELNERFAYSEARLDKIETRIEYMIEQFIELQKNELLAKDRHGQADKRAD